MINLNTSVLFTEKQIAKKVRHLAGVLSKKFQNKKIYALGILKGSFVFYTDLLRQMKDSQIVCDFCATSSYGQKRQASEEVHLTMDLSTRIRGKDVLLVEDIVDRGLTLHFLQSVLKSRKPKSLTTVALISKPHQISHPCQLDYVCFSTKSPSFLVGYGLDYQEQFRHLPYIAEIDNLN